MHACTACTLIFLHPVTYHLWDKSCAEQMHRSWPTAGKTSVLRQRRRDAFSLTLIERKQSPFICSGSQKSTALAHKRPRACPSSPTHTHTRTHACTNLWCTCLWLCTVSFYRWGLTSWRDGAGEQFCLSWGFYRNPGCVGCPWRCTESAPSSISLSSSFVLQ